MPRLRVRAACGGESGFGEHATFFARLVSRRCLAVFGAMLGAKNTVREGQAVSSTGGMTLESAPSPETRIAFSPVGHRD